MSVPTHFTKLKEDIENLILDRLNSITCFAEFDDYWPDIRYRSDNIDVLIWPTIIGVIGRQVMKLGIVEYQICNTPNIMVESIIHRIFKEFNEKYHDMEIPYRTHSDIIGETPTAI